MEESILDLKVPRHATLEIDVVSASVAVNEVAGKIGVGGIRSAAACGSTARH
jgi:hypothetical protein